MKKKLIICFLLSAYFLTLSTGVINAQVQSGNFSGNDPSSYQCVDASGNYYDSTQTVIQQDPITGLYMCPRITDKNGDVVRAILKPPTLQQIEIWFVRIVYAIWALVGLFSFLMLVYLGYRYLLRAGTTDSELVKLRKDILNFIIGFCLVFLAIPILNTVFRVMGVNDTVKCYSSLTSDIGIGFQFFFADLCTDPKGVVVSNPCVTGPSGEGNGLACATRGQRSPKCGGGSSVSCYVCTGGSTWKFVSGTADCYTKTNAEIIRDYP